MYKISKLILAVFMCLAVASSVYAKRKEKVKVPLWMTDKNKAYPSSSYYTGVGDDANRDNAELKAVEELASIFGMDVNSSSAASKRMTLAEQEGKVSTGSNSSLSQNILTHVNQENLIGVEIKDSYYDEKHSTWYVLAVIDIEKVAQIYVDMINKNQLEMSLLLKQVATSEDKYTIDNYARLDFAKDIALVTDGLIKRLSVIKSSAATPLRKNEYAVASIQKKMRDYAINIPICIDVDKSIDTDGRIAKSIATALSSSGFNTTSGSNERYVVRCDIYLTDSESANGSTKFCEYAVDGVLTDSSIGEDLIPFNFNGREGSPTIENARQRAKNSIVKKMQATFVKQFNEYLQSLTSI